MCSNLKLSKSTNIKPGARTTFRVNTPIGIGARFGTWGFSRGLYYNARYEHLNDKWSKFSYNRGYIEIVGFHELGHDFFMNNDKTMYVAIIFNDNNEFNVLTEDAQGPVAEVHQRMPVIIGDAPLLRDKWLKEGKVIHLDPYLLISKKIV